MIEKCKTYRNMKNIVIEAVIMTLLTSFLVTIIGIINALVQGSIETFNFSSLLFFVLGIPSWFIIGIVEDRKMKIKILAKYYGIIIFFALIVILCPLFVTGASGIQAWIIEIGNSVK